MLLAYEMVKISNTTASAMARVVMLVRRRKTGREGPSAG
jgi:hypothetical protein